MKSNTIALSRLAVSNARLIWWTVLTSAVLLTFFGIKVIQGRAEVKAGQFPKPSVARQPFTSTNGQRFILESQRGKVVVVQFLGTWCGVSKRQVQSINQLVTDNQSSDLQVMGMSVKDPRSNSQAVRQFIADQKVNYPIVSEVDDKYFVDFVDSTNVSVPQTLIYGRDGRLIAHYVGFNPQVGTEIEQKVKNELAKK
ncbi:MAG TPA: TlpA disulfide reductase family protein [Blastocatellia bacterium]|nr:TlpA disulfide reductase family protein [Blastocatellia bacterium]